MTLVVFLLILSFLVLIHEAGHLVAAKIFGVRVEEFGFGYPPRAKLLFKKWGTEFTLNWLPFGGFVRLTGEERSEEVRDVRNAQEAKKTKDGGLFYSKRKWQRIVIILAGAGVNFLFGVAAFSLVYSFVGIPTLVEGVEVAEVVEDAPAFDAGLEVGDAVVSVTKGDSKVQVGGLNEFVDLLAESGGETLTLGVLREGEDLELEVYSRTKEEVPEGEGAIGVAVSERVELLRFPVWQMPFRGAWTGVKAAVSFGALIIMALWGMIRDLLLSGVVPTEVAGPVGIVHQASKEGLVDEGLLALVNFAGILSINLAIVNILPIPALDGGRVVFVLLEKVLGKRFKPVYEHWANMVGFGLLISLIVLISLRDVKVLLKDFGVGF